MYVKVMMFQPDTVTILIQSNKTTANNSFTYLYEHPTSSDDSESTRTAAWWIHVIVR